MPNGSVYTSPIEIMSNVEIGKIAKEGGVYDCLSSNDYGKQKNNTTVNGDHCFVTNCDILMSVSVLLH